MHEDISYEVYPCVVTSDVFARCGVAVDSIVVLPTWQYAQLRFREQCVLKSKCSSTDYITNTICFCLAVAVAALRDLQEQLAKTEQDKVSLRREADKAKETAKDIQKSADKEATNNRTEVAKLRQLIIELKDALHQAVQVNKLSSVLRHIFEIASAQMLHTHFLEVVEFYAGPRIS